MNNNNQKIVLSDEARRATTVTASGLCMSPSKPNSFSVAGGRCDRHHDNDAKSFSSKSFSSTEVATPYGMANILLPLLPMATTAQAKPTAVPEEIAVDDREKKKNKNRKQGNARGRRNSWKKPKDMPRRPLSPYNLFYKDRRKVIVRAAKFAEATAGVGLAHASRKKGVGFNNLTRTIAAEWKAIEHDELAKAPYLARAAVDRERYYREMASWRAAKEKAKARKPTTIKQAARKEEGRAWAMGGSNRNVVSAVEKIGLALELVAGDEGTTIPREAVVRDVIFANPVDITERELREGTSRENGKPWGSPGEDSVPEGTAAGVDDDDEHIKRMLQTLSDEGDDGMSEESSIHTVCTTSSDISGTSTDGPTNSITKQQWLLHNSSVLNATTAGFSGGAIDHGQPLSDFLRCIEPRPLKESCSVATSGGKTPPLNGGGRANIPIPEDIAVAFSDLLNDTDELMLDDLEPIRYSPSDNGTTATNDREWL